MKAFVCVPCVPILIVAVSLPAPKLPMKMLLVEAVGLQARPPADGDV